MALDVCVHGGLRRKCDTCDLAEENEQLRRIVCHLHPADAPDPLTLRLARLELGEDTARLFCEVIEANHD